MAEAIEYKVVEVSLVTEDELTRVLNEKGREGWIFDGFHFVTKESSHRPAMAFALFRRPAGPEGRSPSPGSSS